MVSAASIDVKANEITNIVVSVNVGNRTTRDVDGSKVPSVAKENLRCRSNRTCHLANIIDRTG